jgi:hypothetical protein
VTRMQNEMVLTCMRWCHGTQVRCVSNKEWGDGV